MNDIRMDSAAVRRQAEALWETKEQVLKPEVERIAAVLMTGLDGTDSCESPRGAQSLGVPGGAWSGDDFGARHDGFARQAVTFLTDLVDGYTACANGAAAAAENHTEQDNDTALVLHETVDGADFPVPTVGQEA